MPVIRGSKDVSISGTNCTTEGMLTNLTHSTKVAVGPVSFAMATNKQFRRPGWDFSAIDERLFFLPIRP